jgi:SNF2 family DNA or RNA helicase
MAHGGRRLSWDELRNYDVVLTTYNTLAAEYKRWEKFLEQQHAAGRLLDREIEEGPLRKLFPLMGPKSLFYRVILDEAQCIKNKSTMAAKAAYHLKSSTRICLTGTPMMNNVGELFSLIHFLRIRPYNDYKKFQEVSHSMRTFTSAVISRQLIQQRGG